MRLNAKKARELRKQAKLLAPLSQFKKFNRPQTGIVDLIFRVLKGQKPIPKGKFHRRSRTGARLIYHFLKRAHKNHDSDILGT